MGGQNCSTEAWLRPLDINLVYDTTPRSRVLAVFEAKSEVLLGISRKTEAVANVGCRILTALSPSKLRLELMLD